MADKAIMQTKYGGFGRICKPSKNGDTPSCLALINPSFGRVFGVNIVNNSGPPKDRNGFQRIFRRDSTVLSFRGW